MGIVEAFVNRGKDFQDEFEPEASWEDGVQGVKRGAKALTNPPETLDDQVSGVGVRNIIKGKGVVDTDRVWEGILGEDLGQGKLSSFFPKVLLLFYRFIFALPTHF